MWGLHQKSSSPKAGVREPTFSVHLSEPAVKPTLKCRIDPWAQNKRKGCNSHQGRLQNEEKPQTCPHSRPLVKRCHCRPIRARASQSECSRHTSSDRCPLLSVKVLMAAACLITGLCTGQGRILGSDKRIGGGVSKSRKPRGLRRGRGGNALGPPGGCLGCDPSSKEAWWILRYQLFSHCMVDTAS